MLKFDTDTHGSQRTLDMRCGTSIHLASNGRASVSAVPGKQQAPCSTDNQCNDRAQDQQGRGSASTGRTQRLMHKQHLSTPEEARHGVRQAPHRRGLAGLQVRHILRQARQVVRGDALVALARWLRHLPGVLPLPTALQPGLAVGGRVYWRQRLNGFDACHFGDTHAAATGQWVMFRARQ